jgi:hypothetical protein
VPEQLQTAFQKKGEATLTEAHGKTVFLSLCKAKTTNISSDCFVTVSKNVCDTEHEHYLGDISDLLCSAYEFNRKSIKKAPHTIRIDKSVPRVHRLVNLAEARNQSS